MRSDYKIKFVYFFKNDKLCRLGIILEIQNFKPTRNANAAKSFELF